MLKVKSAKDILNSTDFLEVRTKVGKYVHHEFQDYGLRLAHDLGDLAHKQIYLKLAKTIDRTLLEQAAAFALGYFDEPNKGKLFMWKVQQLRKLTQQKKDSQNFDHDFVMSKTAKLMTKLLQVYLARFKADFEAVTEELIQLIVGQHVKSTQTTPDQARVLLIGAGAGHEAKALAGMGFKVQALDICASLIKEAKALTSECTFIKKKHFLENTLKDRTFDLVIVNHRLWEVVPLQSEDQYLAEVLRLLKPNGAAYLGVTTAEGDVQGWQEFSWNEETYIRFSKQNKLSKLLQKLPPELAPMGMIASNYCKLVKVG